MHVTLTKEPIVPSVEAIQKLQEYINYWGDRCCKAEAEAERLRSAFLAFLQNENECAKRGRLCGPGDTCGCKLEMEDYIDGIPAVGQSVKVREG